MLAMQPEPPDPLAPLRFALAGLTDRHANTPAVRQWARWLRKLLPALRQVPPAGEYMILIPFRHGEMGPPRVLKPWDGEAE